MKGSEALEPLLPDGTPEHFSVYGGMLLLGAIASLRTGDPWRAREVLREPAHKVALRVGEGLNYHNTVFGPTNVAIHIVHVEHEQGEVSEALRLADKVDISQIPCILFPRLVCREGRRQRATGGRGGEAQCRELIKTDVARTY
jgi:hypothetical protein